MGFGVVWIDLQGAAIARRRLFRLPCVFEHIAQIIIDLGIIGLVLQGANKTSLRLLQLPGIQKQIAKIVMGFGAVGGDLQGAGETGLCFLPAPRFHKDQAEIVMGLGAIGFQFQSAGKAGLRLIQPLQGVEHQTKIIMSFGKGGVSRQRLADQPRGLLKFPVLIRNHAQQMIGVRVIGCDTKDPAVHRLRQPPRLMMANGFNKVLLDNGCLPGPFQRCSEGVFWVESQPLFSGQQSQPLARTPRVSTRLMKRRTKKAQAARMRPTIR